MKTAIFLTLFLGQAVLANLCEDTFTPPHSDAKIYASSLQKILNNISVKLPKPKTPATETESAMNALPGTVIAAPSSLPDYWFHWIRDAALTMDVVMSQSSVKVMNDYVQLSAKQQSFEYPKYMGEPKFNVDGTPYTGPWGRPQNDGPALRALTLSKFAVKLLQIGDTKYVSENLIPVIERDLKYVVEHWREHSFDLWEELDGLHFYTLASQRAALEEAASLALRLNDGDSAKLYMSTAKQILEKQNEFWNPDKGYVVQSKFWDSNKNIFSDSQDGIPGTIRTENLDVAIILSVLHTDPTQKNFGVTDDRILSTAYHLKKRFQEIYHINQRPEDANVNTAIGRYPEDRFSGISITDRGNPWFLATYAFAEFYYRAAERFYVRNKIVVTVLNKPFFESLRRANTFEIKVGDTLNKNDPRFLKILTAMAFDADLFMARAARHIDGADHISEQFNRDDGYMQSANDLTWSYAAAVTAIQAKRSLTFINK